MPCRGLQCLRKPGHYAHECHNVKRCFRCGSHLHQVKDCPFPPPESEERPGGPQHQRYMPPSGGQPAQPSNQVRASQHQEGPARPPNPQPRAPGGKVCVMRKEATENVPNMVIGKFSIQDHPRKVLFDSDATHSFISVRVVSKMQGTLIPRHFKLRIALPDGKMVNC